MNYRVVFSLEASDDLEEVLVYLALEMGFAPAREYVGAIRNYCAGFRHFPIAECGAMISGPAYVS